MKQGVYDVTTGVAVITSMLLPGVSAATTLLFCNRYTLFTDTVYSLVHGERTSLPWLRVLLVGLGATIGVMTLPAFILSSLHTYTNAFLSFFLGVLLALAIDVGKEVRVTNTVIWSTTTTALILLFLVLLPLPHYTEAALPLYGVLAGTAMVLPGVSGSYTLLILGVYENALRYVHAPLSSIRPLLLLGSGALIGSLLTANYIASSLETYEHETKAVLSALLVAGSIKLSLDIQVVNAESVVFILLGLATLGILWNRPALS